MVRSAVLSVPFSRMASTGTRRGRHSRSLRVRYRCRPRTGMHQAFRRQLRFRRRPYACSRRSGGLGVGRYRPSRRALDDILVVFRRLVSDVDASGDTALHLQFSCDSYPVVVLGWLRPRLTFKETLCIAIDWRTKPVPITCNRIECRLSFGICEHTTFDECTEQNR